MGKLWGQKIMGSGLALLHLVRSHVDWAIRVRILIYETVVCKTDVDTLFRTKKLKFNS